MCYGHSHHHWQKDRQSHRGYGRHQHGGGHHRRGRHHHEWGETQAPANVRELDDRYELHLYAPGLTKADFQVDLADEVLTIKAAQPAADPADKGDWRRREYRPGGFERQFSLNDTIDPDGISAAYTNGVLIVSLPKQPGQETRRQEVLVG